MNTLLIHPAITYEFYPVKLQLFMPMDSILFHFVESNGDDLEGYNLFSIEPTGLNFKNGVINGLGGSLDLGSERRILQVIGVDLL